MASPTSDTKNQDSLSVLNPDRKPLRGPELLHQLVSNDVNGEVAAIEFWTATDKIQKLTYPSLDHLSWQLAEKICDAISSTGRIHKNIIIPVLIPQSLELYLTWLAVLKSGAAFCPVMPDTPEERIKFICQDTAATLVLTTVEEWQRVSQFLTGVKVLALSTSILNDADFSTTVSKSCIEFPASIDSESLAYVQYTSGSTGLPKGVKVTHKAVTQALLAHDEHIPSFRRFLQFASPTFDVSIFETFFPLFRGVTLVSRDREHMLADLTGTITGLNADAAELTPTVAGTLLKSRIAAPCLSLLLTIGEMLTKKVIEEFGHSETRPGILYGMYGPTEASIHCTIVSRMSVDSSVNNIGQPLSTITAFIVDSPATGSVGILQKGEIGELAIAGQLASGYLNRPDQTSAAFIDLPGYGLVYRTGDRARIASDGNIEILGRVSAGQVKLRGQRIELGEIEQVACGTPGIEAAVAAVINETLVLICLHQGENTTVDNVRAVCKSRLPRFMNPRNIAILGQFPYLLSGKIDRKNLEANYSKEHRQHADDSDIFSDPKEIEIAQCISEELDCQLSPDSSLWSSGIDSLRAIKIASRLRELGYFVTAHDLLETDNISDLAYTAQIVPQMAHSKSDILFEDSEEWKHITSLVNIDLLALGEIEEVQSITPCSTIQVAMVAETLANNLLNFNHIRLELSPGTRPEDIRAAFHTLAQKNEILRSGFIQIQNADVQFAQVVWKHLNLEKSIGLLHPLTIEAVPEKSQVDIHMHHALYDGWSFDLLLSDLNYLLAGLIVPDRPQYHLVGSEQRRGASSQSFRTRDYWQERLESVIPASFPQFNNASAKNRGHRELTETLLISHEALAKISRKLRVSRQSVIAASTAVLYSSYVGSTDVLFGSVASGRTIPIPGIENMIGPCITTLPVRIDLSSVSTIQDTIMYTHRMQSDHIKFGDISLHEIKQISGLHPEEKLFDVLVVWQESPPVDAKPPQHARLLESSDSLDYALVIEVEPSEHNLLLKLTYDERIIPHEQARLFISQINHLLEVFSANKIIKLEDVWTGCSDDIIAISNAKFKPFEGQFSLISTIERLAHEQPELIALEFVRDFEPESGKVDIEKVNYGDLWMRAKIFVKVLLASAVKADDLVCVLMEKSVNMYLVILATIIAGSGFLNIDSRTPSARISQILEEVKCKLVIFDNDNILEFSGTKTVTFLNIDQLNFQAMDGDGELHLPIVDDSRLAYAVMTSGTTGIPKAIMVTRRNILSNIDTLSKVYPSNPGHDRLLQACSPAFDVFVFEVFWTWHRGMCLVSTRNDILFRDITSFVRVENITHLSLTPSVAALIDPQHVPDVKLLVTAGEPMNSKTFDNWADRGLFQGYGPAETTNICNINTQISKLDLIKNVGPPLPNTSIFICAKQSPASPSKSGLHTLPRGAVGEIYIGGEQVCRGYMDKNLSAKSFTETSYGRLYRSGDIGRLFPNGDLLILGRDDDQVKIRGQRVELGDINSAILKLEFVADAVTFVVDELETSRLISFWLGSENDIEVGGRLSELFDALEGNLPTYMVPEILIPVKSIPLTTQGKIDKRKLLKHYRNLDKDELQHYSRRAIEVSLANGLDTVEATIASAVSVVTNTSLEKVGPNTSFFALGLDSINSLRLSQRLRVAGLGQIDVSTILRHCSPRRLGNAITASEKDLVKLSITESLANVFEKDWRNSVIAQFQTGGFKVEKILPCTSLQEAMLSQADSSNSTAYWNQLRLQLYEDVEHVQKAWKALVQRHQILRTGFILTQFNEFAYAQVVLEEFDLPWDNYSPESFKQLAGLGDLAVPPYRFKYERPGDEDFVTLTLDIHHALYDAEAMTLLLEEVEQILRSIELPAPVSMDKYLQYKLSLDLDELDQFWRIQMQNYEPQSLIAVLKQVDIISSTHQITSVATLTSSIPNQRLVHAAKQQKTTQVTLIQATWARLLSRYTGRQDVCFGNVYSGRNLPFEGADRTIGPIFNILPVRAAIKSRQTLQELVSQLNETNAKTFAYQPSSLRRIIRNEELMGRKLFDSLILMQQNQNRLDPSIWKLVEDAGQMIFPGIILEVIPDSGTDQVILKLHIQGTEIGASSAKKILENFDSLLNEAFQYPQDQTLNFLSINRNLPPLRERADLSPELRDDGRPGGRLESMTNLEQHILRLFSEFSAVPASKIYKHTTIYEIGLDSISAVQIAFKLRKSGHEVTGADVLEARTLHGLANFCTNQRSEPSTEFTLFDLKAFEYEHRDPVCAHLGMKDDCVEAVRPCTPTQSGMLAQFINSKGDLYFNSVVLRLNEDIDLLRLREAWETIMERHEMLRTGFLRLDTLRYAFGMITYRRGVQSLPWEEALSNNSDEIRVLAKNVLATLHEPCWRISLQKQSSSYILGVHLLHALFDAQSLDRILADVASIYIGEKRTEVVEISPALAMMTSKSRTINEDSERFWTRMGGNIRISRFPDLKISHSVDPVFSSCNRIFTLSEKDASEACKKIGVSMQAVCQVAWARLLSEYTGESNVCFGVVLSGRTTEETANIVFPTISTVPFSLRTGTEMKNMLEEATDLNAGLNKYQFTPMTSIRKWVGAEGDLFDTVLVLQKFKTTKMELVPWKVVEDNATAEYAVSVEILPQIDSTIELRITSRSNIMPPEQAEIVLEQYDHILKNCLAVMDGALFPACIYSIVPVKDSMVSTEVRFLHDFVQETAMRTPNGMALEFVSKISKQGVVKSSWTYRQLNEEGNKIAHLLLANEAKTGDLIAIIFDKCPQASFAILGILKAGCAYVPIDPAAPKKRIDTILKDAKCKLILTTKDKVNSLQHIEGVKVLAADDTRGLEALPVTQPGLKTNLDPEDTCYCLYTSGTTGVPKGCLISHDSSVQAMLSFQRIFKGHWDDNSRWLQFASFHFDVSVLEQYWSWSVGICVTSAPRDLLFEDLPGAINALQITHLDLTPSLARLLTPEKVPSLCRGVFIVGGEQVRQDILETWGDAGCLYNFYGPSEVTIGCTVNQRVPKTAKATNIGEQWENVGTFVLDPKILKPVLRGAVGELCLSGPLVGKGYLNRPELTAEKFIHLQDGTRVYCSGDLVRLLHDNSFEFLGRIDSQLKLRGQRLEVGEVNYTISQASDEIEDVSTMVLQHPNQAKEQLVAFFSLQKRLNHKTPPEIVTGKEASKMTAHIRSHTVERLPAYMVPTYILLVSPRIPLSTNNKGDGKALKALFESLPFQDLQNANSSDHLPPSEADTKAVAKVIEVLSSFLGISASEITPSSRIFELGLDSISAIGFASALRNAGFDGADSATVMRRPAVSDLAHALELQDNLWYEKVVGASNVRVEAFRKNCQPLLAETVTLKDFWPCTALQQDMLAKSGHKGGIRHYLSAFHYLLDPSVDLKKLMAAWNRAQQTFPILRTTFIKVSEKLYGQIVGKQKFSCLRKYSDNPSPGDVTVLLQARAKRWVEEVDVFGDTPCWQVSITETKDGPTYMSLFMFHGLYDAVSLPLILEAVAREILGLPDPALGPDFHNTLTHGPLFNREDAKSFWTEILKDLVPLELSLPPGSSKSITTTSHREDPLPKDLKNLASELEVTDAAVFHAAWLMVLSSRYGKFPTLGVVVSGRNFPLDGVDQVVGPLLATIPCQITPSSKSTGAELIRACHRFNIDSKNFEHTSLRDIRTWTGLDASKLLFDSLFVFQKQKAQSSDYRELWVEIGQETVPDYPLAIELELRLDGKFNTTVVGDPEFLDGDEANFLCEHFVRMLSQLSENQHDIIDHVNGSPAGGKTYNFDSARNTEIKVDEDLLEKIRLQVAVLAQQEPAAVSDTVSIFQLGLDSVDAIRLSAALRGEGVSLSVNTIMRLSKIEQMARYVSKPDLQNVTSYSSAFNLEEIKAELFESLNKQGFDMSPVEKVLPTIPMQEGILASFEKYYHFAALKLRHDTDETKLINAWNMAFNIHPILRSRFVEVEDPSLPFVFAQLIMRPFAVRWEKIGVEHESNIPEIISVKQAELSRQGLMYESITLSLITTAKGGRKYLLLGASHAIYDGWSIEALHQDISNIYQDKIVARPPLEPYLHYILGQPLDIPAAFWKKQLASFTPPKFPCLGGVQKVQEMHRATTQSRFSPGMLRDFCMDHGVTIQSLGLCCMTIVLSEYTKKRDVSIGLVSSGRTTQNAEELMFPTFNTVTFRPNFPGGSRLRLLRHIHELGIEISEYQNFPLREAKKLYGRENELFDTLFVMQKLPDSQGEFLKLYDEINFGHGNLEYPVNIELDVNTKVMWSAATSARLLSKEESINLLQQMENTLKMIIEHPNVVALAQVESDNRNKAEQHSNLEDNETDEQQPIKATDQSLQLQAPICEVLALVAQCELKDISATTNLFTLGLDSISAIKVSSILKKTKSISLPVSSILRAVTVERMSAEARWVENTEGTSLAVKVLSQDLHPKIQARLEELGIPATTVETVHSASAGQLLMLDFVRMSNGMLFYPIFRYKTIIPINTTPSYIRESLLKQFPILRTKFFEFKGQTFQAVLRPSCLAESQFGWQLAIRSNGEGTLLSLRIHHALYDAASLPMIISAIERACNGEMLENQRSDPALSRFLDSTMNPETQAHREDFWTNYLIGSTPTSFNRRTFSSPRIERISNSFLPNTSALYASARNAAVSIQALFYAAVGEVYAHLLDTSAVVIGVWLANRGLDIDGLESLAAPTVNIVPLRIELGGTLIEIAKKIQRDLEKIQREENCGISLREIWGWTGVMVECFVNFVRVPESEEGRGELGGVRLVPTPDGRGGGEELERLDSNRLYLGKELGDGDLDLSWCVPAIDIEAKLDSGVNGGLTVGVFAPGDMMGEKEVQSMVERLREGLKVVCD